MSLVVETCLWFSFPILLHQIFFFARYQFQNDDENLAFIVCVFSANNCMHVIQTRRKILHRSTLQFSSFAGARVTLTARLRQRVR